MPTIPRKTINTTYIHTDMRQLSRHPFGLASEIQPQAQQPASGLDFIEDYSLADCQLLTLN